MIIEVSLLDEEIYKCKKFAEEVVSETFDRFNKSVSERIERIFFGKLGELAFLKLLQSKDINSDVKSMFEIYKGPTNTDSFDFVTLKDEKVDIKTAYRNYHKKILIPQDQFERKPKEFYVGVKIILDKKKAIIFGYSTKENLMQNGKKDFGEGPAYWEDLENLKEIGKLLAFFK